MFLAIEYALALLAIPFKALWAWLRSLMPQPQAQPQPQPVSEAARAAADAWADMVATSASEPLRCTGSRW